MERLLNDHLDKLPNIEDALEGDIISMDFGNSPQHCGIITKINPRGISYWFVVHALRHYGVVEGRLYSKYLKSVKSIYRLRGLVD
jgi:hypothetical protein